MLPWVECACRCRGSSLPAQHISDGLKALEERERRGWWRHRPGLAIRRLNAIEHAFVEFRAGLDYMFVRVERLVVGPQRDSRDGKPAEICCAHAWAIGIASFPRGRVQHASSRMPIALQNSDAT